MFSKQMLNKGLSFCHSGSFSLLPHAPALLPHVHNYVALILVRSSFLAPTFAQIVCEADQTLQVNMRDFVITHVFNAVDEEDGLDDEGL